MLIISNPKILEKKTLRSDHRNIYNFIKVAMETVVLKELKIQENNLNKNIYTHKSFSEGIPRLNFFLAFSNNRKQAVIFQVKVKKKLISD